MREYRNFYINGQWAEPQVPRTLEVINPATETPAGVISVGGAADVDLAVAAARKAFVSYSESTREERLALLERIIAVYQTRMDDLARATMEEMGAPITLAVQAHVPSGLAHFMQALEVLKGYAFEERRGTTSIRKEPIGVCALITPWNWPLNQIACKVAPALAAGCTVVLKPSEISPLSAVVFAEIMHEAGVPAGVFNLVNGDGPGVGAALSAHPDVDMVSFTGSTRAGIAIGKSAAETVKRVALELGGKSANILLDDADFEAAVAGGVAGCFINSGQTCSAPTRMLVPEHRLEQVEAIATAAVAAFRPGKPDAEDTAMGPVANAVQFRKIQSLIEKGIGEDAKLLVGGPGRPEGLERGFYVKPTIFSRVNNRMTIAREEIFGPVLVIIPYGSEEEAIEIANDTPYGLSGYVWGAPERAQKVAARLRTGSVFLNGAPLDFAAPFGGYKQSGNGREWGEEGLAEFLEIKAVMGWYPA